MWCGAGWKLHPPFIGWTVSKLNGIVCTGEDLICMESNCLKHMMTIEILATG